MLAQASSGRPAMRTRKCRWREGFIEVSKELAPTLMRWGGCFSSFYRWKEAVGADALMCVNFESDGRKPWMKDPNGNIRSAGPRRPRNGWIIATTPRARASQVHCRSLCPGRNRRKSKGSLSSLGDFALSEE